MKMRSAFLAVLALVFSLIGSVQAFTFVTRDVPGSSQTEAIGISDAGHVVGHFEPGARTFHGFIFDGSTYTTLDVPEAAVLGFLKGTRAQGVNNAGVTVGVFNDLVAPNEFRGFVYNGTTYTLLDVPGSTATFIQDINDAGSMAGWIRDAAFKTRGFIFDGSTYSTLDVPGTGVSLTQIFGINNLGHAAGAFSDGTGAHGFIYDGSTYRTLDVPGATRTAATGINDLGVTVGWFQTAGSSDFHGFVFDGSTYLTIDVDVVSGVTGTIIRGINNLGVIAGTYDTGVAGPAGSPGTLVRHGFVGIPPILRDSSANFDSSGNDGDPVNTFTGELFSQFPSEFNLGGPMPLLFTRYYASKLIGSHIAGRMGANWRHNFEWSLSVSGNSATVINHKGRLITFSDNGTSWDLTGTLDIPFQFAPSGSDYVLYDPGTGLLRTFNSAGVLNKIEDGKGNTHTLTYSGSNLSTVSDGLGRTLTFAYNGDKLNTVTDGIRTIGFSYTGINLTQVTDVLGNNTTYVYESGGLMTSSILPAGNTPFAQTWDSGRRVASQTNADGNTTTFAYAAPDTTITDALGDSRVHSHTLSGELDGSTDGTNNRVAMGSDADGRRSSITDRLGDNTSMTYHAPSGKLVSQTNADGSSSGFSYTARTLGNVTQYDLTSVANADGTTESLTYDVAGNLISRIDRAGNASSSTYNANGLPLTVTNSAGGVTTYTYNADATVAMSTDPAGNATMFAYDALRRLNLITYADSSTRQFTYDDEDRLLSEVDENANAISMTYDVNGNLATMTDPLNNVTTFTYDGNDRLLTTTDQLGGVVSTSYDALGRPATTTSKNNNTTTRGYDTLGRLITIASPMGNTTGYTYDSESVVASSSDDMGNTSTFTTDKMGRLTQETSALGNVSQTAYDVMGRTISTTDPLSRTTSYSRDIRGLLSSTTLPGGTISITNTRNSLGDITRITDANGHDWQSNFNNQGQRTSRTDPLGNVQITTFDNRNRPDTITYADGVIQTIAYDPVGNPVSRSYNGSGPVFNYSFDANDRLVSANDGPITADNVTQSYDAIGRITDSNGIAISRDIGGRIIDMTLAPGKTVSYAYDVNDNLVSVTDWNGAVTGFGYDSADRLTGITRPAANGIDTVYGYDVDVRLISVADGVISNISLVRDAGGQVTSATRSVPLAASAATLISRTDTVDTASQISTAGFIYDVRGRLENDGSKTYTWDGASRLSSVMEGSVTTHYTYDSMSQRLSRSSGGVTRNFVWNTALALNSISIERDGASNDLRYFIHTPLGALLYSIDAVSNARHFYHYDETGNTIAITDDSGNVIASYAYTPYGKITASTGGLDNPFTWQGQYGIMDEGNGLYNMRARYYDSTASRFLSRDLLESIDPGTVNPYQYASGNPLKNYDPSGLEDLDNGFESLKDLTKDFAIDFIPFSDFVLDPNEQDNVNALKLTKATLAETVVNETAGKVLKVVKVAVLGGKIVVINYNEYQNLLDDRGKNEVHEFLHERRLNAEIEAKQALLRDRDVDSLSSMSPLARDLLRQKALGDLKKVYSDLTSLKQRIENSVSDRDKAILENHVQPLEDKLWFLLNAVAGELVPGETGWVPPSNREAANEPSLGK